jgi:hypothetical protein
MISYSGIFRAAKLMIDQHGVGAATFATGRPDLLLEDGDPGCVVVCFVGFTPTCSA